MTGEVGAFICGFLCGFGIMLLVLIETWNNSITHATLVKTGHGEYVMPDATVRELKFQLKEMK